MRLIFLFYSWSSHQRCSVRKGIFRNFAKFTGKHLCQSLFFNKGKFHIKTSRKKSKSSPPPQNLFSFRPWLDTLKLDKKPKFQVLRSSGTLLFQSLRIGPLDQKMTATMWKWGLPYVSRFQFFERSFTK